MDNEKSYEFIFLYLINKCILLFKYIKNDYQKEILFEIKIFVNKLNEVFATSEFNNNVNKKNKILEVLIEYFENIIENKIYNLINLPDKEKIIQDIEQKAIYICEKKHKEDSSKQVINDIKSKEIGSKQVINDIKPKEIYSKQVINDIKPKEIYSKQVINDIKNNDFVDFENKMNNKIKSIFLEIENNIKTSLKNYFDHTQYVEYDLDKKFNEKMQNNNVYLENKIKEYFNNNLTEKDINELIKEQIKDIYLYVENILKSYTPVDKKNIMYEMENKIRLLGNIFNENIKEIFNNLNSKIVDSEQDILRIINERLMVNEFNKNNFNIAFDKENNEIKLYYFNDLITSTKINIKGLIGPKGPQGNKGDSGYTPIIRRVQFTDNNRIKFIIQENNEIYEVISDNNLPPGPQGIPGERGVPGKTYLDLKWNQENVMRIDDDVKDSLIFLKSLCIGDKSHCLKDNSLAIAGAKCFNNNSFALGMNSKTLDSDSIALYGTCIGKKSFAYRADNVDENMVQFGKKDKNEFNINSFDIISKEINIECDNFKIKTNKYENNKIKELEDKIISLEKKVIEISKKF